MTTDPIIRDILERRRQVTRNELDSVMESLKYHRATVEDYEKEAEELTRTLDAIEAELGVGAFAEVTA